MKSKESRLITVSFVCPHSLMKMQTTMCRDCFAKSRGAARAENPNWNDPVEDGRATVEDCFDEDKSCFLCEE